ncbi:MAG TPA: Rho termination factor N-terminal domain-containing protein, partial [Candidatus Lustribacter sp.]|nr:Rho termination factor N-terminal domain-containing protein [Candidatus Lustribacter sp.]
MNVVALKGMASTLGITGTAKMRKGDLVAAIAARQSTSTDGDGPAAPQASHEHPQDRAEPRERSEERSQERPPREQQGRQQHTGRELNRAQDASQDQGNRPDQ